MCLCVCVVQAAPPRTPPAGCWSTNTVSPCVSLETSGLRWPQTSSDCSCWRCPRCSTAFFRRPQVVSFSDKSCTEPTEGLVNGVVMLDFLYSLICLYFLVLMYLCFFLLQTHTLPGSCLAELATLFLDAIKGGKMGNGKSLELFPTVITALSGCETLSYGKGKKQTKQLFEKTCILHNYFFLCFIKTLEFTCVCPFDCWVFVSCV